MFDCDDLLKGLECCSYRYINQCHVCPYEGIGVDPEDNDMCYCSNNLCEDAAEAIKKMNEMINKKQKVIARLCTKINTLNRELEAKPEIVKCSECEFGKEVIGSHNGIYQTMYECISKETFPESAYGIHPKDWFCANGERKDDG